MMVIIFGLWTDLTAWPHIVEQGWRGLLLRFGPAQETTQSGRHVQSIKRTG
jgi:hypothetical protein